MTDNADIARKVNPAFPSVVPGDFAALGLSKRELFAAMAMQGLAASAMDAEADVFAAGAVMLADALIAELAKGDAK